MTYGEEQKPAQEVPDINRTVLSGLNANGPECETEVHIGTVYRSVSSVGIVVSYSVAKPPEAGEGDIATRFLSIPVVIVNLAVHEKGKTAPADLELEIRNTLLQVPRRVPEEYKEVKVATAVYSHGILVKADETKVSREEHKALPTEDVVESSGVIHKGAQIGRPGATVGPLPNGNKTTMILGGGTTVLENEEHTKYVIPSVIQVKELA